MSALFFRSRQERCDDCYVYISKCEFPLYTWAKSVNNISSKNSLKADKIQYRMKIHMEKFRFLFSVFILLNRITEIRQLPLQTLPVILLTELLYLSSRIQFPSFIWNATFIAYRILAVR